MVIYNIKGVCIINKKGFTLIEMLAVVVILAILFLFVTPKLALFIKNGGKTNEELIEQKVLNAAKEYVNDYDTRFLKSFIKEGDSNYIYKSRLIDVGLITEKDASELDNFVGVKAELLKDDKMKYSLSYIANPLSSYSNEELYSMIENLQSSDKEVFLKVYPVGSIYISTTNTNPSSLFGGTWVSFGSGRTLVGVGSGTDANGESKTFVVNSTGGEYNHTLTVAEMPSHSHELYVAHTEAPTMAIATINKGNWTSNAEMLAYMDNRFMGRMGNSQSHNNLQPYITTYMWKRTA